MDEKIFFDFLNRDPILHIFTIYDLKYMRDKTKVWVALKNGEIHGYIFEFDNRIVHTHGTVESIAKLLDCIDLDEVTLGIEDLDEVSKQFGEKEKKRVGKSLESMDEEGAYGEIGF